jgi:flavin-dependent dehydrogenase
MLYDCAIIGGGLGGLALSILLAKSGKQVILFEKESYPFHKVCGEYISMESYQFIKNLGISLRLSSETTEPNTLQVPYIDKLLVSACNGNVLRQKLVMGGFGISRYTLDKELATIARQMGVILLENTKVENIAFAKESFTITSNSTQYQAKIACAAYGKKSNIDVKLQRNFVTKVPKNTQNFVAVKYHLVADLPTDGIELHNFKDGYAGISKVDTWADHKNRFCLCYLTNAKNLQDNHNKIAEMESNVLMKNPFLKRYLSDFERLYDKPLVISQINFEAKNVVENHLLMLGDAAGMITPLCGNGMSMALHSAKLLHLLLVNYLENHSTRNELEMEYQTIWKQNFWQRVYVGRMLQKLFGNEYLTNFSIATLKQTPFIVKQLVGLTHGKVF